MGKSLFVWWKRVGECRWRQGVGVSDREHPGGSQTLRLKGSKEILPQNCPCLPQTTKPEQQSEKRNSAFIPLQNPGAGAGFSDCCTRSSCSWCHQLSKSITFPRSSHCRWLNIEWVGVAWFCYSAWVETPWVWIQNSEFWILKFTQAEFHC